MALALRSGFQSVVHPLGLATRSGSNLPHPTLVRPRPYEVQPAEPAVSERPKRRWYQFSLKTLLVVLTLLCIGPGSYVGFEQNKARKQKAAVKAIERISGFVQYDKSMAVRPAAVRQVLGDETFGNVNLVQ